MFRLLKILFTQDFGFPFTQILFTQYTVYSRLRISVYSDAVYSEIPFTQMPFTQFAQKFRLLRFQKYVYSDAKKCLKTAAFRPGTQRYSQKKSSAAGSFTQIRLLRPRLLTILRFRPASRARLQDTNKCVDALTG